MLEISPAQKRELRARAHHLAPVVSVAEKGLTDSVVKEIRGCLTAHELIKVRVYGDDRAVRVQLLAELCERLECAAIQHIGKLLVLYKPAPATQSDAPAKPARSTKPRKAKAVPVQRPGRPTTARPPRAALQGEDYKPRSRKPSAGSSRPKKSAR